MKLQGSSRSFSFLLESSPTPIYRRLTAAYQAALVKRGYPVVYIDPNQFNYTPDPLSHLMELFHDSSITHFLIFDSSPLSNTYLNDTKQFVFEQFESTIVFLHHDHLSSSVGNHTNLQQDLLAAWERVKDRSIHFCLEYANFLDLKSVGFEHVYQILHASEFEPIAPSEPYTYDISFVGHILPNINQLLDCFSELPYSHKLAADAWSRLVSVDKKIDRSATLYAEQIGLTVNDLDYLRQKFAYFYSINFLTSAFRGELIKRLDPRFKIDIVGGDPGYLNGAPSERRIERGNIRYHPPTLDYAKTRYLYATSKINLNITSLQFDDAVVNRVIDIASVGGFVLTDWKADLAKLTSVSEAISYKTIDELNGKIDYYLSHESERNEIAHQLHDDITKHCTYDRVVDFLLSKISPMTPSETELMCVDLGCGRHKPEGFVGVDVSARPGVDVIADLNQRFPFPDNSVDFVRAHDLVEHLQDRIHTMNEIWRICKPNATVDIRVPSTDGRGAFQDPTHISFWNINSFAYYTEEFPEHLDLCHSYGFRGAFNTVKLEHESEEAAQIIHVRAILRAVKPAVWSSSDLVERLKLRSVNYIIFPDWSQPSDQLYLELTTVIRAVATHIDRQQMTLLVDQGNYSKDSEIALEEFLYEVVFGLFLNEGIDVANEGLEISIVGDLNPAEFTYLHQQPLYRISLTHENKEAIATYKETMPVYDLSALQQRSF